MTSKESRQVLSEQEVSLLRKEANPFIPVFTITASILFGFWLYFMTADDSFIPWGIGVGSIMIISVLYTFFNKHRKIRQDLNEDQKVIIKAKLENRREDSSGYNSKYYCTLANQEFEISFDQWKNLKSNQLTEIHFAPYSRYIFLLNQAFIIEESY